MIRPWLRQKVFAVAMELCGDREALCLCEEDGSSVKVLKLFTTDRSMYIATPGGSPFGIDSRFTIYPLADGGQVARLPRPSSFSELMLMVGIAGEYGHVSSSDPDAREAWYCRLVLGEAKMASISRPDSSYALLDARAEPDGETHLFYDYERFRVLWKVQEKTFLLEHASFSCLLNFEDRTHCARFNGPNCFIHDRRCAEPIHIVIDEELLSVASKFGRDAEHFWGFTEKAVREFDWRAARWRDRLHLPFAARLTGYAAEFWI
jgi:hypothetical protein